MNKSMLQALSGGGSFLGPEQQRSSPGAVVWRLENSATKQEANTCDIILMEAFCVAFGLDKEAVQKWLDENSMCIDVVRVVAVGKNGDEFLPPKDVHVCDVCGGYIIEQLDYGGKTIGYCCL